MRTKLICSDWVLPSGVSVPTRWSDVDVVPSPMVRRSQTDVDRLLRMTAGGVIGTCILVDYLLLSWPMSVLIFQVAWQPRGCHNLMLVRAPYDQVACQPRVGSQNKLGCVGWALEEELHRITGYHFLRYRREYSILWRIIEIVHFFLVNELNVQWSPNRGAVKIPL